jgi:hypothetical protein
MARKPSVSHFPQLHVMDPNIHSTMYPPRHHSRRLVSPRLLHTLPQLQIPDTHLLARRPLTARPQPPLQARGPRERSMPRRLRHRHTRFLARVVRPPQRRAIPRGPKQHQRPAPRNSHRCQSQPKSNRSAETVRKRHAGNCARQGYRSHEGRLGTLHPIYHPLSSRIS